MTKRLSSNEYFLKITQLVAERATCVRRKVGCVLVDKNNHILSTGYNGVPSGFPHCIDNPCLGASFKSGQGLDKCLATHAEQNALLQCNRVNEIDTAYLTLSPCITCIKLFLNTPCQKIVFLEEYNHNESRELWERAGRIWLYQKLPIN